MMAFSAEYGQKLLEMNKQLVLFPQCFYHRLFRMGLHCMWYRFNSFTEQQNNWLYQIDNKLSLNVDNFCL